MDNIHRKVITGPDYVYVFARDETGQWWCESVTNMGVNFSPYIVEDWEASKYLDEEKVTRLTLKEGVEYSG